MTNRFQTIESGGDGARAAGSERVAEQQETIARLLGMLEKAMQTAEAANKAADQAIAIATFYEGMSQ